MGLKVINFLEGLRLCLSYRSFFTSFFVFALKMYLYLFSLSLKQIIFVR